MFDILIALGAIYLVLLAFSAIGADRRSNDWLDAVGLYPIEIGLSGAGWIIVNIPLVAAALLAVVPLGMVFGWLLYEAVHDAAVRGGW